MKELASEVGTSQQQIDRLEKGQRRLTLEWVEKISAALDCELIELLPQSIQSRDGMKTARAKVVGEIEKSGGVKWFKAGEPYCIIFGRPTQSSNLSCLMALRIKENNVYDFQKGDELIFSECEQNIAIADGKLVLCSVQKNLSDVDFDNKMIDAIDDKYEIREDEKFFIAKAPADYFGSKIRGVLIKTIRNE